MLYGSWLPEDKSVTFNHYILIKTYREAHTGQIISSSKNKIKMAYNEIYVDSKALEDRVIPDNTQQDLLRMKPFFLAFLTDSKL